MNTPYLNISNDVADILAYFRQMFPYPDIKSEEQIISVGFTIPDKKLNYEEPILNFNVSLTGNWKLVSLASLEDLRQGKDKSLETFENRLLYQRKDDFRYNRHLNLFFNNFPKTQNFSVKCLNFEDGVRKLFHLAITDPIRDTAEGLPFRSIEFKYFSQPILIKQTTINEYQHCDAFIWEKGNHFVDFRNYAY